MILEEFFRSCVNGRKLALIGNKISQKTFLILSDRSLKASYLLGNFKYLADPVRINFRLFGNLLRSWFTTQLLHKTAADSIQLINSFKQLDRNPNCPCLIGNGSGYGLAYPPGCIGRKLITLTPVVFLNRSN